MPTDTKSINLIGAGKLGKTISYLLHLTHYADIKSVCNRSLSSSQSAVDFIGSGKPCTTFAELKAADIYLISVPDDQLEIVIDELLSVHQPKAGSIFIHFSGTKPASIFEALRGFDGYYASLHPLHSFADPKNSIKKLVGTFCTYEGDEQALPAVKEIIEKIGGIAIAIEPDKKSLYHSASVFACNYLVSLFDMAMQCYQQAGISQENAKAISLQLMQNTINNLQRLSPKEALTGPIARGDWNTIETHRKALEKQPDLLAVYQAMFEQTLKLSEHKIHGMN